MGYHQLIYKKTGLLWVNVGSLSFLFPSSSLLPSLGLPFSPPAISKWAHLSCHLKTDGQKRRGEKIFWSLRSSGEFLSRPLFLDVWSVLRNSGSGSSWWILTPCDTPPLLTERENAETPPGVPSPHSNPDIKVHLGTFLLHKYLGKQVLYV